MLEAGTYELGFHVMCDKFSCYLLPYWSLDPSSLKDFGGQVSDSPGQDV